MIVPLNDSLSWSDGKPVTAHDIVFTFDTARSLGLEGSWAEAFPTTIGSMHADSEYELRIEFTERPNLGVWPHGPGLAPIMAAHVWQPLLEDIDMAQLFALPGSADVGGGPLALATVSETLVTSTANPGYPFGSTPDTVEYHIYEDEDAAVAALGEGQIDFILTPKGLTEEHLDEIASNSSMLIETSPANGVRYVGFNLGQRADVRPGFSEGIDAPPRQRGASRLDSFWRLGCAQLCQQLQHSVVRPSGRS